MRVENIKWANSALNSEIYETRSSNETQIRKIVSNSCVYERPLEARVKWKTTQGDWSRSRGLKFHRETIRYTDYFHFTRGIYTVRGYACSVVHLFLSRPKGWKQRGTLVESPLHLLLPSRSFLLYRAPAEKFVNEFTITAWPGLYNWYCHIRVI